MGAWQEIVDYTFTANETSRTFSGLSITKDDFVKVVVTLTNETSTNSQHALYPNGDTTATNYYTQRLFGNGSTVAADRGNNGNFAQTNPTIGFTKNVVISYLKLSENDKYNLFTNEMIDLGSTVYVMYKYITSTSSFSSGITSLTLTGATNTIGTGSRIQIYKLAATKVADITVATNTTQVDISSLSIDKDSEYLLVSDINNSSAGTADYWLTPNDLTTTSGYFVQRLIGNGSTAQAIRTNEPRYTECLANTRVVAHTHIKLSNIGAFTTQSYGFDQVGTSTSRLLNSFVSSTAENITSITKLNIKSASSNQIGSGSRFTLYKLYE